MRKLSVSMMCVDYGVLNDAIDLFEEEKVDYLHIDVMDGSFVPNLMLGTYYEKWIHDRSRLPLDLHLMIEEPFNKLEWFDIREGDMVSIHAESGRNILGALLEIRKKGAKAMIAISPETSVESIIPVMKYIDGVNVMLVIPGFSGQSMIEGMEEKVAFLKEYRDAHGLDFVIEVDGHVCKENIRDLEAAGADVFVAGTSLLGKDFAAYRDRVQLFYNI